MQKSIPVSITLDVAQQRAGVPVRGEWKVQP